MHTTRIATGALALVLGSGAAQARGGHGGHWDDWGWAVGLAIGLPLLYDISRRPVVVQQAPPVVVAAPAPAPQAALAVVPPEPVVYPSGGQSAAQTEADRQACNRWAASHPGALADASVFHRATLACLAGRGYTVR